MVTQLALAQFSDWARSQSRPLVLDVREPWEIQTASVQPAGFELLTIAMQDIPSRLAELPPNAAIACLCHHGMRSLQVAHFLSQQGFTGVVNLQGGIDAWSREVDPSVPRY